MKSNYSDYFISDQEKSLERLSITKLKQKKYHENEDRQTTMERLIEADKESSGDESDQSSINQILMKENEVTRSSERNYKSHFQLSPKTNKEDKDAEDSKGSESGKQKHRHKGNPKRRARYRKAGDVDQQKESKFYDEEMMVNYYVLNLILIQKKADALRAINEYYQKPGISELGKANLLKTHACILMNKSDGDLLKSIKLFKEAGALFYSIGCKKGSGLCKFALAKMHNE